MTLNVNDIDLSDLVAKSSPALHEEARSAQLFGSPITPDTMVVQRDPAGVPVR